MIMKNQKNNHVFIRGIYDPSLNRLIISYKNKFFKTYSDIFKDLVNNAVNEGRFPKNTEAISNDQEGNISIPLVLDSESNYKSGDSIDPEKIPASYTECITDIIANFRKESYHEEFKKIEFIPLNGYSYDNLKEDIREAIRSGRDYCIINEFSDYEQFTKGDKIELVQKRLKYLENDYLDVSLLIYEGKIDELKEMMKGQLEEESWE